MIMVSAQEARELQVKLADYRSRMLYDIRALESLTVASMDQVAPNPVSQKYNPFRELSVGNLKSPISCRVVRRKYSASVILRASSWRVASFSISFNSSPATPSAGEALTAIWDSSGSKSVPH